MLIKSLEITEETTDYFWGFFKILSFKDVSVK